MDMPIPRVRGCPNRLRPLILVQNNGFTSSLLGRLGETQTEPPLLRLASQRDPATQHQPVYDPMVFDANIEVRRGRTSFAGTNFVGPVRSATLGLRRRLSA